MSGMHGLALAAAFHHRVQLRACMVPARQRTVAVLPDTPAVTADFLETCTLTSSPTLAEPHAVVHLQWIILQHSIIRPRSLGPGRSSRPHGESAG